MPDQLSDIGAELFRLLTECPDEWRIDDMAWLYRESVAVREAGPAVMLFVNSINRGAALTISDAAALEPVITALKTKLRAAALADDRRAVRAALKLPAPVEASQ